MSIWTVDTTVKIYFSRLTSLVITVLNYGIWIVIESRSTARLGRKGLRRIWELPYKFRSDYLSEISGTSPIYDELCRRCLNFIITCNSSDSKLIRFVIGHVIYCARVQSPVGRNYVLCYERMRYGSKVEDEFTSGIKSSCCGNDISIKLSSIDRCRITFAFVESRSIVYS